MKYFIIFEIIFLFPSIIIVVCWFTRGCQCVVEVKVVERSKTLWRIEKYMWGEGNRWWGVSRRQRERASEKPKRNQHQRRNIMKFQWAIYVETLGLCGFLNFATFSSFNRWYVRWFRCRANHAEMLKSTWNFSKDKKNLSMIRNQWKTFSSLRNNRRFQQQRISDSMSKKFKLTLRRWSVLVSWDWDFSETLLFA